MEKVLKGLVTFSSHHFRRAFSDQWLYVWRITHTELFSEFNSQNSLNSYLDRRYTVHALKEKVSVTQ